LIKVPFLGLLASLLSTGLLFSKEVEREAPSANLLAAGNVVAIEKEPLDLMPNQQDTLLNHLIRQQLTRYHFDRENRPVDDAFSANVFKVFLDRVDPQKRLLLKVDVEGMKPLIHSIDDHLKKGEFHLPAMAHEAVHRNLLGLIDFAEDLLSHGFDYDLEEHFETDPEKIDYCDSVEALQNRWRRHLKYQALGSYLNLLDSEETLLKGTGNTITTERDLELREKARQKSLKQVTTYFRRLEELNHQDHFSRYFNSITAGFDPHTSYMDPETKEDFSIKMSKSLEGIGAVLQQEDDFTKIVRVVPGSASYRQGDLKAGDIILRVGEGEEGDEIDITGMRLREVVKHIRGEKGTTVRLTVKKSNGDIMLIKIVRDIVKLEDQVAKSTLLKDSEGTSIGYIYLPDFYRDHRNPREKNCTEDVRQEIRKLKRDGMEALVFDLRGNGGGFLEDARTISGLFIERGPIVQVKDSFGQVEVHYDHDRRVEYEGPLLIMVDQFSASASEIVAAALQDYGRAVILGSGQTHGKGTVQHLLQLNRMVPGPWKNKNLGDLKLTIQKFYRIDGGSTQHRGVQPDIILPDAKTYMETGERYLDHALAWDKISKQKYRLWPETLPLDRLNSLSEERVKKSEIFKAISERLARLEETSEETVITLSANAMVQERKDNKAEGERYQKLLDELKEKLDPIAAAEEKEERENKKVAEEDEIKVDNREKTPEQIKAEVHAKWSRNVGFDPYVREAMKILKDMMSMKSVAKAE